MEFSFPTQIFHTFSKLSFVVFIILLNAFEIYCKGPGGLMFGYKGKSYSFTTETCQGGVFFNKPIALDYLCPNGYFLKRSRGCSAKDEDIVGAEHYVCTEYSKHQPKVQALIPVTNPDYPTDHTVTLYDDEDLLTGYRRYTIESAARKKYIPRENGSSFVLITNPHNTPDMNIGRLCYSGMSQAEGSAYKVEVQSNFSDGESYGFFSNGCKESSVKVQPSLGKRFGIKDGTPDSKRFARAIPAKVINLEDDADVAVGTHRVIRKDNAAEKVFLDLDVKNSDDENIKSSKEGQGSKSEEDGTKSEGDDEGTKSDGDGEGTKSDGDGEGTKSDGDGEGTKADGDGEDGEGTKADGDGEDGEGTKADGDGEGTKSDGDGEGTKPTDDKDKDGTKSDEDESDNEDQKEGDADGETDTKSGTGEKDNEDSDKQQTGADALDEKDGSQAAVTEAASEDGANDVEIMMDNSNLKSSVIINPDKTILSPYFYEILEIAKSYVKELHGDVDDDGEPIESDTKSFLDIEETENRPIKNSIWYQILKASVDVVEKIAPKVNLPVESEIFRVFSYLFRHVDDDYDLISEPDKVTLESILDKMHKCGSTPAMKPPTYEYYNNSCPPELESIDVSGGVWNATQHENDPSYTYDKDVVYSQLNMRENDLPNLLGRYAFQPKYNHFVEVMFSVFDIASIYCFMDFQKDLNAHSRMTYYMMQHLFYNENVQSHWYSDELDQSIYLTMVPSWDGRPFYGMKSRTRELDILRHVLRQRVIPHSWIERPDIAQVRKMSLSEPIPEDDLIDLQPRKVGKPKKPLRVSFGVSDRDSLPPPRRPKINRDSLRRTAGILGTRSNHPRGKMEWLRRKRREVDAGRAKDNSLLKGREIWDGLAYCLSMIEVQKDGQTKQLGLEPSLQTFRSEYVC